MTPTKTDADRYASLYKQHNKNRRCNCERGHCQKFRQAYPRLAATVDGEIEIARRSKQYRQGDYT